MHVMNVIRKGHCVLCGTASVVAMTLAAGAASAQAHWKQHDMDRPRPEVVAPAAQTCRHRCPRTPSCCSTARTCRHGNR